jgi:hypothetical protein
MTWIIIALAIPVYALGHGLGMLHCRYIIGRWPEKNGFRAIPKQVQP